MLRAAAFAVFLLGAPLQLLGAVRRSAANSVLPPWVVIAAGSNGYQNYRHQADACHAYQVALANGVPADHIIVMIYDDVAHNEGNPFPGKLFNTVNGSDVYAGCKIDYSGNACSMDTFFKVLHGNKTQGGSGRVLQSTSADNVFIVYTDHGAPGYVTFPSGVAMHAIDLSQALVTMHELGRYQKLLLYMDACNSGSMFADGLLKAPSTLAVVAAMATEESYAAFCPPYDRITSENNREVFSCLGDVFSINWMFDANSSAVTETVGAQISRVANATESGHVLNRHHNSHPEVFGDVSIRSMVREEFQAGPRSEKVANGPWPNARIYRGHEDRDMPRVSSRDVPLVLAQHKVAVANDAPAKAAAERALAAVVAGRDLADLRFASLAETCKGADLLKSPVPSAFFQDPNVVACYKAALRATAAAWGEMDDYSLQFSGLLANLCGNKGADATLMCIEKAIEQ